MGKNKFHQSAEEPSPSGKAIVEYNNPVAKDVPAVAGGCFRRQLPVVTPWIAYSNLEEVCTLY